MIINGDVISTKTTSFEEIDKFWHKMSDDREIIPTIIDMQEIKIIGSTDTD